MEVSGLRDIIKVVLEIRYGIQNACVSPLESTGAI